MFKSSVIKKYRTIVITIIVAIAVVSSHFLLAGVIGRLQGTDDQSVAIIQSVAPQYSPWFRSLWEPGSDAAETVLFAFQTVIGISVIILYIVLNERKKVKANM